MKRLTNFKQAITALGLGTGLMFASGVSANAQGQYDPYYGQRTYRSRDYSQHQKNEKRAEKWHQKDEKEDLKAHQPYERDQYGNDADLRYHQQQEREELNRHHVKKRTLGRIISATSGTAAIMAMRAITVETEVGLAVSSEGYSVVHKHAY
jgi:hypothetical protein